MAQFINEAKRMQQLAGIITEEEVNELFGFGAPTLKIGDKITIEYDRPLVSKKGEGDLNYFEAVVKSPTAFAITKYRFTGKDFDEGADENFYGVGISSNSQNVGITTGKGEIEKGKQLSINGSGVGPKVTKIILNGKEVSKVSLPKK